MKSRNIIYFGNVLYPDLDAASHRTIGNAKALRELGYNVTLVGTKKGENRPIVGTKEIYDGFEIYYFPDPQSPRQWKDYLISTKPLDVIVSTIKDVKAVILYNHPSISSKKIVKYCHKRGIEVYADCTEWYDPKGLSIHTIIKKADTFYRMRFVNKHLDGIIAISSYLQDYYKAAGCATICVPPIVDLTSEKWQDCDNLDLHGTNTRLIYVGNPGAGAKDKLGLIISALKTISRTNTRYNFHLNVIGMTDVQFKEVFKVDTSNLDFVSFLGRKPNNEALEMIKQSDFSIFLRDANLVCTAGFPTKFSESIACGTPVLTNLTSDLGKYMVDGRNGFVIDMTSYESICDTLLRALSVSAEKKADMKSYCREDRTFDYHSFIMEFKKIF